ncbi:MAG: hypothetical protein ACPG4T_18670, partial [Nannocystaceae bacterium]
MSPLRHLWLPAGLCAALSCQAPQSIGLCGVDTPIQLLQISPETQVVGWRVGDRLVFQVDDPSSASSSAISMNFCGEDKKTLANAVHTVQPVGETAVLMCDAAGTVSLLDLEDEAEPRTLVTGTDCRMTLDGSRLITWQPQTSDSEYKTLVLIEDVFDLDSA